MLFFPPAHNTVGLLVTVVLYLYRSVSVKNLLERHLCRIFHGLHCHLSAHRCPASPFFISGAEYLYCQSLYPEEMQCKKAAPHEGAYHMSHPLHGETSIETHGRCLKVVII